MFRTKPIRCALMLALALAPMIGPTPLQAFTRGLVRSSDFSQVYWVDRFGVSHHVSDTGMIPIYFKNDVIKEISWDEWMKVPKGGPISPATPPEFYDTSSTRITAQAEGLPTAYNATTTTSLRKVSTIPVVETKTVTTDGPALSSSTLVRTVGTTLLSGNTGTGSAILDSSVLPASSSSVVEKRVQIYAPGESQTNETISRRTIVQKRTDVSTPEVTQTRVEQLPSTALLEKRVRLTRTTAPLGERHTTVTYGDGTTKELRTLITFDAPPVSTQQTVTTVTQPTNELQTITTESAVPVHTGHIRYDVPETTEIRTDRVMSTTEEVVATPE